MHHSFALYAEDIAFVSESVTEGPYVSIARRFHELEQAYGLRIYTYIHIKSSLCTTVDSWR